MRVSVHDGEVGPPCPSHELAGADQLISDLAALIEAGLVAVHEHVLGPPRYGVAPAMDRHNGRRHHAQLT